jgi:predicted DNA-binding transcriptional regulator AlpA
LLSPTLRLISVNDASALTGLSPMTIRGYCYRGKLTRYKIGEKRIALDKAEVEALIQPRPASKTA